MPFYLVHDNGGTSAYQKLGALDAALTIPHPAFLGGASLFACAA